MGIYAFKVNGGPDGTEGYWIVDAKNGTGSVEFNGKAKPDVTLTLSDGDLVDLMRGKLNSQKAFFQGKLKTVDVDLVDHAPVLTVSVQTAAARTVPRNEKRLTQ